MYDAYLNLLWFLAPVADADVMMGTSRRSLSLVYSGKKRKGPSGEMPSMPKDVTSVVSHTVCAHSFVYSCALFVSIVNASVD